MSSRGGEASDAVTDSSVSPSAIDIATNAVSHMDPSLAQVAGNAAARLHHEAAAGRRDAVHAAGARGIVLAELEARVLAKAGAARSLHDHHVEAKQHAFPG